MQENVLARYPGAPVRVLAIWFSMYPGDSRAGWDAARMPDPRATHFWDEGRQAGRFFAQRVDGFDGVLWDAYFLYGRSAQWQEVPGPLESSGSPVISAAPALEAALSGLFDAGC